MTGAAPARLPDTAWLAAPPLSHVLDALNGEGIETRIVGGAVRDTLLGLKRGDVDLATTAPPEEVAERASSAGIHAVPTGIDHGTVTLVAAGRPFEVTTLRRDVESHGRRATVAFGADWEADARRRDFTMNALYAGRDGTLHDPLGGYGDLVGGHVRFIGDPRQRIAEDYLRILRFFRFHAAYGRGELDPGGLSAVIAEREGLLRLSAERLQAEMLRLLAAPRAADALEAMADSGILGLVTGGVAYLPAFRRHLEAEKPDALLALAVLAARIVEDGERLALRLRLSKAQGARLTAAAEGWWRIRGDETPREVRAMAYRLGGATLRDRARLARAVWGAPAGDEGWRAVLDVAEAWQSPAFPLAGADILALGVPKGPEVGRLLRRLEEEWIAGDFSADRAALLARAKKSR